MGNPRFRLSNIIPKSCWSSARKSVTTESPLIPVSGPKKPQHCTKPGECSSNKALPVRSFDQMLILSSSSRSFSAEHALPPLTLTQPRRPGVYKSSVSDDSPRRRKVHTAVRCCPGVRLKQKSPRLNGISNARRSASGPSSSCSGIGTKKRRALSETSVTVVKSSANPDKDFKESMVEMIVENNITDLDGLEELLISYLVLNSEEFHQVIVNVFKEIVTGLFTKPDKWIL